MPLSEHEQRLLEEMERSLYQSDADFVATVSPRRGRTNYTLVAIGVLIAVVGVGALVAGVIIQQPLVGVLGFAIMFTPARLAIAPPRRDATTTDDSTQQASRKGSASRFMDALNDRWDQRQDGRE